MIDEPKHGQVIISSKRIHELAVPLGEIMVKALKPTLEGHANDHSISPEEFTLTLIYMHCQGIAAAIESAVKAGANKDQLQRLANKLIDTMEAPSGSEPPHD